MLDPNVAIQTIDLNAFYLVAQCRLKIELDLNVCQYLKILPLHYLMYQSLSLLLLNISNILVP